MYTQFLFCDKLTINFFSSSPNFKTSLTAILHLMFWWCTWKIQRYFVCATKVTIPKLIIRSRFNCDYLFKISFIITIGKPCLVMLLVATNCISCLAFDNLLSIHKLFPLGVRFSGKVLLVFSLFLRFFFQRPDQKAVPDKAHPKRWPVLYNVLRRYWIWSIQKSDSRG